MITLANLSSKTEQEVFNHVAIHLLTQNAVSRGMRPDRSGAECLYRNEDGLKCAAGCLIGDDEYVKSFEGQVWRDLIAKGLAPEAHARLINDLQFMHDRAKPEDFEKKLRALAAEYHLNTQAMDAFLNARG